ncbi:hypothetical protein KIPB_001238 [Kipferlia bialata]|uniref:Uncharacterized protein n=1 Tax=Kipferlia bialata TaxID=797122 RepID=A0A9K3CQD9_9EUKA|nr:hypothetical protein KIPB_001238 [Kipferlia bialata]|eukprot:g1238.t1
MPVLSVDYTYITPPFTLPDYQVVGYDTCSGLVRVRVLAPPPSVPSSLMPTPPASAIHSIPRTHLALCQWDEDTMLARPTLDLEGVCALDTVDTGSDIRRESDSGRAVLERERRARKERQRASASTMMMVSGASLLDLADTLYAEGSDSDSASGSGSGSGLIATRGSGEYMSSGSFQHTSSSRDRKDKQGDSADPASACASESRVSSVTDRVIQAAGLGMGQTLPQDVTAFIEQSLNTSRSVPCTKHLFSNPDQAEQSCRIGGEEFSRRASWLNSQLFLLDPQCGTQIRQFQSLLEDVSAVIRLCTPSAVCMNPEELHGVVGVARYELSEADQAIRTPLPASITAGLPERDITDALDGNTDIAGVLEQLLKDLVRDSIVSIYSGTVSESISAQVDASIQSTKRHRLRAMVQRNGQRPAGTVQTLDVDEGQIQKRVMCRVRDRNKRLLRMLDCMVVRMLGETVDLFSQPWREVFKRVDDSAYLLPPCLTLSGSEDQGTPSLYRLWPCHVGGVTSSEMAGEGIPPVYPSDPLFTLPLSVSPRDPEGWECLAEGVMSVTQCGGWSVTGLDTQELALKHKTCGAHTLLAPLSAWPHTKETVLDTLDPYADLVSVVVEAERCPLGYTNYLRAKRAMEVYTFLRQCVEGMLCQHLGVSAERIQTLTGHASFDAILVAVQTPTPKAEGVSAPPSVLGGEGQRVVSLSLLEEEWGALESYQESLCRFPSTVYYSGACTHLESVRDALRTHLVTGRHTLLSRHVSVLEAVSEVTLQTARALQGALTAPCPLPADQVVLAALVESTTAALPLWLGCLSEVEAYCSALLTHGADIPHDTHLTLTRLAKFVHGLPETLATVKSSNASTLQRQRAQLGVLARWMGCVTATLHAVCDGVTRLGSGTEAQLEEEAERGVTDRSPLAFLYTPFPFPEDDIVSGVLMGVTSDMDRAHEMGDVPPSLVTDLLMCGGLLMAFQAHTGLTVLPQLVQPVSGPTALSSLLDRVSVEERHTPFTPYTRPASRRHVVVREVLCEIIDLLDRSAKGMSLIRDWADEWGLGQSDKAAVKPSLSELPGDPRLVYRVNMLMCRATDTLDLLREAPVDTLDHSTLSALLEDMQACTLQLETSFGASSKRRTLGGRGKDEVSPNYTFKSILEGLIDTLSPTVNLVRLLTADTMQTRHLDVLESRTGLPVLQMDRLSIPVYIESGALNMLHDIADVVSMADEERAVEDNLDSIQKTLDSWSVQLDTRPDLVGGFDLPDHFFHTLRAAVLYVQRDVGSHYAQEITLRARKLEATTLSVIHSGSMVRYCQQYLMLGSHLMSDESEHGPVYMNAKRRWYQIRKSLAARARVRLLTVLTDSELTETLQGILLAVVPVVRYLRGHSMTHTLTQRKGGRIRNIQCVPEQISQLLFTDPMVVDPVSQSALHGQTRPQELYVSAQGLMYNIDGMLVQLTSKARARVAQTEGETDPEIEHGARHVDWEITAMVSGLASNNWRTEVLRLNNPVPMPPIRGLLVDSLRSPVRHAVRSNIKRAVSLLYAGDMDSFRDMPYHSQFIALNFWMHEEMRRATISVAPDEAMKTTARKILAQVRAPESHPRLVLCQSLQARTEYNMSQLMPVDADDDANMHLPVLSALCVANWYFEDKNRLCLSSLGAHIKTCSYDWLGTATEAEVPDECHGSLDFSVCEDYAPPTMAALLARGVTLGLCSNWGDGVEVLLPSLLPIARIIGQIPMIESVNRYRTPELLAHNVSNLLIDGHLVILTGMENAPPEMVNIVSVLAKTLHTGGEFPYASSEKTPFLSQTDTDLALIRRPMGKELPHLSEHSIGTLVLFLPNLEPGPFRISRRLPDSPIRYADVRPAAERLRYVPRSAGRPCLSLRTTFSYAHPKLFLEPRHLATAVSLTEGTDDTPCLSVYKYLSMSFKRPDREGLRLAVAASFNVEPFDPPSYGEGEGLLTGEGVYASRWISSVLQGGIASRVCVQTRVPVSAVHLVRHSARACGASVLHIPHYAKLREYLVRHGRDTDTDPAKTWICVDMAFDPTGAEVGRMMDMLRNVIVPDCLPRMVFIFPSLPHHSMFHVPTCLMGESMLDPSLACMDMLRHSTGVKPDTTSQDRPCFFFGMLARFCEIVLKGLDSTLMDSEGSFLHALVLWLLAEDGLVTLEPVSAQPTFDGGRISLDVLTGEEGIYSLPNVGSAIRVVPNAEGIRALGESSTVGNLGTLFLTAFAVVYSAFSIMASMQNEFSPVIYQTMVGITSRPGALASLQSVHTEFAVITTKVLEAAFPDADTLGPFQALRFNPEFREFEVTQLRDPIEVEDHLQTHPRWSLPPCLTDANRAFAHSIAACLTFGVHCVLNSSMAVGKTWVASCARFLLPSCVGTVSEVVSKRDTGFPTGLSMNVAITPTDQPGLVPLFSHCLAVCVDYEAEEGTDVTECDLFQSIVSRTASVSAVQRELDISQILLHPNTHARQIEQDDHFCVEAQYGTLHSMTLFLESHLSADFYDVKPLAFVMEADLLVDHQLVTALTGACPVAEGIPDTLAVSLPEAVSRICEVVDMSPLTLLGTVRKMGMLATRSDPSLYYLTPALLVVALTKSMCRPCESEQLEEVLSILSELCEDMDAPRFSPSPLSQTLLSAAPTNHRSWSDILSGLQSGTGAPPPKTFFFVSECFGPLLPSKYDMPGVLKGLSVVHPVVVPTVLQSAVEIECWLAVNNTVAESAEDAGISCDRDTLSQLRVPCLSLILPSHDSEDLAQASQVLWKALNYSVDLAQIASSGYKKKARGMRSQALRTQALVQTQGGTTGRDADKGDHQRDWETGSTRSFQSGVSKESGSRYGNGSVHGSMAHTMYTTTSMANDRQASFFGDSYERYLPRLLLDMSVLSEGLGLPASLALPLLDSTSVSGETLASCVTPYKVFPGGDVKCQLQTKYVPEQTLFSRVLLRIPEELLQKSEILRLSAIAFHNGYMPPVFSNASMGQVLMVLGEKYSLPQPDVSVLVMKLSQHLVVCSTATTVSDMHMAGNMVGASPSPLSPLLSNVPSTARFLDSKYGTGGVKPEMVRPTLAVVASVIDAVTAARPDFSTLFSQFVSSSMAYARLKDKGSQHEYSELTHVQKGLASFEKAVWASHNKRQEGPERTASTALLTKIAEISAGLQLCTPPSASASADPSPLVSAGAHLSALLLFAETAFSRRDHPVLSKVVESTVSVGGFDPSDPSLSLNAYLAAVLSSPYHHLVPHPIRTFLWLYLDLLPPVDTAVYACAKACLCSALIPDTLVLLDPLYGVRVAQTVEMWAAGALDTLSTKNTADKNTQIVTAARKSQAQAVRVLSLDTSEDEFHKSVVSALETGANLIFHAEGARASQAALSFLSLLLRQYQTRSTRSGQAVVLGRYVVRLGIPTHRRRIYLCIPPETLPPKLAHSSSLLHCVPDTTESVLPLMGVMERATPAHDVGPIHATAILEEDAEAARLGYWAGVRSLSVALRQRDPTQVAQSLMAAPCLTKLHQKQHAKYRSLCQVFSSASDSNTLNSVMSTFNQSVSESESPLIRAYADTGVHMARLETGLSSLLSKGSGTLDRDTVVKAGCLGLCSLVSTAAVESLDMAQFNVFVCTYLLTTMVAMGHMSLHDIKAGRLVLAHDWERLASMVDREKQYQINLKHSETLSRLRRTPDLKEAFNRLVLLESCVGALAGLTDAIFDVDSILTDAIQIVTNPDSGLSVLASLVGNSRSYSAVFGDRKVVQRFNLPKGILGQGTGDATLVKHLLVVSVLNPTSALVTLGAWLRASSAAAHMQQGLSAHETRMSGAYRRGYDLGQTHWSVLLGEGVSTLISSDRPNAFMVVTHVDDVYASKAVCDHLYSIGHTAVYGLFSTMPVNRMAVVPIELLDGMDINDPRLYQPCKVIVLVPRGASRAQTKMADHLLSVAVSTVCLPEETSPLQASLTKIRSVSLDALSDSPHFIKPSIAVSHYVSPLFSRCMRRMLLGYILSFGLAQHYPGCGAAVGMDGEVSLELLVRQITTTAKLVGPYATEAKDVYARRTLAPPPPPPGIQSPFDQQGAVRLVNEWHRDRAVTRASWFHPAVNMYDAFLWVRKFHSCKEDIYASRHTMRHLRLMTDVVCFDGPASHMGPCPVEVSGVSPTLDRYDAVAASAAGNTNQRTSRSLASHVSRQSNTFTVGAPQLSTRGGHAPSVSGSVAHSIASHVSGKSSASSAMGTRATRRLAKVMDTHIDQVPRVTLLYPSPSMTVDSAVPAMTNTDVAGIVKGLARFYKPDTNRCTLQEYFGPKGGTLLAHLPAELVALKTGLGARGKRKPRLPPCDECDETDLDDESYEFLDVCSAMLDDNRIREIEAFVSAFPVAKWRVDPADLSPLSYLAMHTVVSVMRVAYAQEHEVPLDSCFLRTTLVRPITEEAVVKVPVEALGFCLSHDGTTAVSSSVLLPTPRTVLYLVASSDYRGRDCDNESQSSQSISGVSVNMGLGGHHVGLALESNSCEVPVFLGRHNIGSIRLRSLIDKNFWGSVGARFEVVC